MDKEDPPGVISIVWFTHSLHRRQWGSALPLGVTLRSVQPWSYYRWWEAITASGPFGHCHLTGGQWLLVEVVGICTKESRMTIYLQCLYHLVQQFWEITCGPEFPCWLVPDHGSDRTREGRWLWPVLKWDLDVFQDRLNVCFMDSVGKHTDLRPLLTVVILAVGVSNTVSGFYRFIADRPHSIGYVS